MTNAIRNILIVEDELLVALDLEDILTRVATKCLASLRISRVSAK